MAVGFNQLLVENLVTEVDAFIADIDTWPGDQFPDLLLRLATKGAFEVGVELGHRREASGTLREEALWVV